MQPSRVDSGFTLAEVCVAMLLLVVTSTGAARLISVSVIAAQSARIQTSTTVLASQKIESFRALIWPDAALAATPAGSLDINMTCCTEYLDGRGGPAGSGMSPSPSARFVRRWSIAQSPDDPFGTVVVQVLVTTVEADRRAPRPRRRMAGEALVITMVSRRGR